MKLGLGLYRPMLTRENLRFAKQIGCTHIVAHLTDYFSGAPNLPATDGAGRGWGVTENRNSLWRLEELVDLRELVEAEGLTLEAVENFDPAHWYDILLDGPEKATQLENIKTTIRRMGEAGIPTIGYNFSLAGVWGHVRGSFARGGAMTVGFLGPDGPAETPIPNGQIWNMTYQPDAPPGIVKGCTQDELWQRLADFLAAVIPVAEESGVRLAAHPDDPPTDTLRSTPRLVNQPHLYDRLLDLQPSRSNALEFCMGSIQEMTEGDVYQAIDHFARRDAIAYIHFRNVRGKVPHYHEVFVDEGDIDMLKALRVLRDAGYDGVLIPDHTPDVECGAPWHAGMAFALGYMRAGIDAVMKD